MEGRTLVTILFSLLAGAAGGMGASKSYRVVHPDFIDFDAFEID